MVGQKAQSASVEKMISETHSAALEELQELQTLPKEIQALVKELDGKLPR